jgi:hypothetical protein
VLARAWRSWKRIAQKIGDVQARLLLTVFYVVLMFPFGIAVLLFFDPLRVKRRPTQWLDRPDESEDLNWAKRQ